LTGGIPNKTVSTVHPPIILVPPEFLGWLCCWIYWNTAQNCTKSAWELHATFRKVV